MVRCRQLVDTGEPQIVFGKQICLLWGLKASELKRKLANAGCTFVDGKKHLVIYYKGNRSLMPRHPAKEVKTGTVQGILKKLGIEEL